jgi:hypothetical protein
MNVSGESAPRTHIATLRWRAYTDSAFLMEVVVVVAILLGLLVVALIALITLELKRRGVAGKLREANRQAGVAADNLADVEARCQNLAKYQGIVDAEAAARSMVEEATGRAAAIVAESKQNAESVLAEARARLQATAVDASGLRASAVAEAERSRERGVALLTEAETNAAAIVEQAKRRADEIAGEAQRAIETADRFEQTAQAMKNVIEGYGDQYVIPTFGLLDELAETFGFAEAGQKLKAARENVRDMIRNDSAAMCDYVEHNRRTTAIEFVLDAFNGKVDSTLADVRHDNFGTLQQKIKDAYSIVNNNGAAFRSARITNEYLTARLEELRWAVVAQ